MKKISVTVLLSLALLIWTTGISSAVEQQLIKPGFNIGEVVEPNLWDIMSLPMMTGQTITQEWVNTNQSGQQFWSGDMAVITAYSNYALTYETLHWGDTIVEGLIMIADADGDFAVNIPFDPASNSWFFINWSDNHNVISPYAWPENMVSFDFDDYYIVAFEDWDISPGAGGDQDYQDLVLKFSIVPEPISSVLFIIGATALGLRRFYSKRKNT